MQVYWPAGEVECRKVGRDNCGGEHLWADHLLIDSHGGLRFPASLSSLSPSNPPDLPSSSLWLKALRQLPSQIPLTALADSRGKPSCFYVLILPISLSLFSSARSFLHPTRRLARHRPRSRLATDYLQLPSLWMLLSLTRGLVLHLEGSHLQHESRMGLLGLLWSWRSPQVLNRSPKLRRNPLSELFGAFSSWC